VPSGYDNDKNFQPNEKYPLDRVGKGKCIWWWIKGKWCRILIPAPFDLDRDTEPGADKEKMALFTMPSTLTSINACFKE
jgi:hypothetical protein